MILMRSGKSKDAQKVIKYKKDHYETICTRYHVTAHVIEFNDKLVNWFKTNFGKESEEFRKFLY